MNGSVRNRHRTHSCTFPPIDPDKHSCFLSFPFPSTTHGQDYGDMEDFTMCLYPRFKIRNHNNKSVLSLALKFNQIKFVASKPVQQYVVARGGTETRPVVCLVI